MCQTRLNLVWRRTRISPGDRPIHRVFAAYNRAEAYLKLHDYIKAVADISMSIKRMLSSAVFLMNIDQFRKLYPEYNSVAEDVLCERIRSMFFPNMKYADFAKQFLIEAREFKSTVLPNLYVRRGDAYAEMHDLAAADREYDRVEKGFPEFSFTMEDGKRVGNSDET